MICPEDNCSFESSEHGVKFHYGQAHDGSLSGVVVECDQCGAETRKDEYRLERSDNLFCSSSCHDEWRAEHVEEEDAGGYDGGHLVEVECEYCGEVFEERQDHIEKYDHNFCDEDCYADWRSETGVRSGEDNGMFGVRGPDHPAWEGGHDQKWRRTPKWRRVARRTYRQYDYTCNGCGATGVELHAHHIEPVHEGGAKYDADNLVALCAECHYDKHSN